MAQITDFMQYQLQTGKVLARDKAIEAFSALSVLLALEDITQEINAVVHIYSDKELFPDEKTKRERMTAAAKMFTNGRMYNLQKLLFMHAANLYRAAETLTPYIEEPPAKDKLELKRQREALISEYMEQRRPFVCAYLKEFGNIAIQEAEKLTAEIERREKETDSNEGRPQE